MVIASLTYINLDQRVDRRENMERMLKGAPLRPTRFPAIRLETIEGINGLKVRGDMRAPKAVASIWKSHSAVLESFCRHPDDGYFLLLEDDVWISPKFWEKFEQELASLPSDWKMVMFSPRYRLKNPSTESGGRFVASPRGRLPTRLSDFEDEYFITGAHFCVFKNKDAVSYVLSELTATTEIIDVDRRYAELTPVYGLGHLGIKCGGWGSDHN